MNDRQIERAQFAGDAAARREQIFEHQAKRDFVLREFLRADVAHAVFFFDLFQHINDIAAASFLLAVDVTADRLGLLLGFVGNFFGETEVERADRAGLDAKGLLVFADAIAAHGAFAGFAGDVVLGDDFPRASVDAVFAADANVFVDDHGAFFIFGNCFDGTHRGAGGEVTVHATVARPKRRETFEHRWFHGDPIRAG